MDRSGDNLEHKPSKPEQTEIDSLDEYRGLDRADLALLCGNTSGDSNDFLNLAEQEQPGTADQKYFDPNKISRNNYVDQLCPRLTGDEAIQTRLGLEFAAQKTFQSIIQTIDQKLTEHILSLQRFINKRGKDPQEVLDKALHDSQNIVIFGLSHEKNSPADKLLENAIAKLPAGKPDVPPNLIMPVELPDVWKSIFEAYNNRPTDAKLVLPEKPPKAMTQAELSALATFMKDHPDMFAGFEKARTHGVVIIPVDTPECLTVDPKQLVRGGERNPAREEHIKDNLIEIAKKYPNITILLPTGGTHAAELDDFNKPVANLLANDRNLKEMGRQVVSFYSTAANPDIPDSIDILASSLNQPVCFSANDLEAPGFLRDLEMTPSVQKAGTYGNYDYIVANPTQSISRKNTEATKQFVPEEVKIEQKDLLARSLPMNEKMEREIRNLFANHGITIAEVKNLGKLLNEYGREADQAMRELLTDKRGFLIVEPDYDKAMQNLLVKNISALPSGSVLAIGLPKSLKPFFAKFNAIGTEAKFEELFTKEIVPVYQKDQGLLQDLVKLSSILQIYHEHGIKIVPYSAENANRVDIHPDIKWARQVTNDVANIQQILQETPDKPVIVWTYGFASMKQSRGIDLPTVIKSDPAFKKFQRTAISITCANDSIAVSGLKTAVKSPVMINLDDPSLATYRDLPREDINIGRQDYQSRYVLYAQNKLGYYYDRLFFLPR